MSARLLDGQAVAAAIREAVLPEIGAFTAAGRPSAGPRHRPRRRRTRPRRSTFATRSRRAARPALRVDLAAAARRRRASTICWTLVDAPQRQRGARRHPRAGATAGCDGQARGAAGVRRDRSREGRRRVSSSQRRAPGAGARRTSRRARRQASSRCSITTGIRIAGARAVVIGRSEIVGKPMAMLLLQRDATVTICHSKTPDLPASRPAADILVAAIGRAGLRDARVRQAGRDGRSTSASTA